MLDQSLKTTESMPQRRKPRDLLKSTETKNDLAFNVQQMKRVMEMMGLCDD